VTAQQFLALAKQLKVSRREATTLLSSASGRSHAWLIAHEDAPLAHAPAQAATLAAVLKSKLEQLADDVPLAYLLGHESFGGLTLRVTPDVLVPRADTQTLVDWALACLRGPLQHREHPVVVDLGTGSGAVALAIKTACPHAQVHAVDVSVPALGVATANAQALNLDVSFHQGSWWQGGWTQALGGPMDLAVANPPYIAQGDAHLHALRHEPQRALTAGPDGLDDLRTLIDGARRAIPKDAWLLLEHGHNQASSVQVLFQQQGFESIQTRRDESGRDRCTGGRA
jgi:release factor glutamine methyltransferase